MKQENHVMFLHVNNINMKIILTQRIKIDVP